MRGRRQQSVRGQHPLFGCAGPDHVFAQQAAVRKFGQCRHGRANDRFVANHHRSGRTHNDVITVVLVQRGDAPIFPYLFGDPDDVVGEVFEFAIKAVHF